MGHKFSVFGIFRMILGYFVFAAGIVLTIHANIGLAPWDVFHQGLANLLGITIGQASILAGAFIVTVDFFAGERIGWGTLGNMLFIGLFIDFLMLNQLIPEQQVFWAGVLQVMAGLFVIGIGTFLYMSVGLGSGPRDGLMVALVKKTNRPVLLIRGTVESLALLLGWILGGTVGLGTLIMAVLVGPMVQLAFRVVGFDVKAVRHSFIDEDLKMLRQRVKSS